MTPHLNRLDETVQMRGHNIWFRREIRKLSSNTPSYIKLCFTLALLSEFQIMQSLANMVIGGSGRDPIQ